MVYYHQPLRHSDPNSATFPLRATITVFNDADVATAVNHVNCGGYELPDLSITNPDILFKYGNDNCSMEIAHRYHANYISIEYRYYQFSAPPRCWENLDDLKSVEAAEDFHNFFEALKKVMKGKWVMSGVSKGGITTLLQHHFHPEDMDIFVPYSAPFFESDREIGMQKYWFNNGLTKEYRDLYMNVRIQGISDHDKIYMIYYKMNAGNARTEAEKDSVYADYLYSIAEFGFYDRSNLSRDSIAKLPAHNAEVMHRCGIPNYCDTIYAYMIQSGTYALDSFPKWLDTLRKYPAPKSMPVARPFKVKSKRPFGISEEEWWFKYPVKESEQAYEYLSKTELGFYDLRFDEIVDESVVSEWNEHFKKYVGTVRDYMAPYYASLTFDRSLYDNAVKTTRNATKPIVFIYGEDDPWTGAAMKDQYINGQNVKKFILPAQNHGVNFSSNTDINKCDEIRAMLDRTLNIPQGIEDMQAGKDQRENVRNVKIVRNGHVHILRGDRTYTIQGQEVK